VYGAVTICGRSLQCAKGALCDVRSDVGGYRAAWVRFVNDDEATGGLDAFDDRVPDNRGQGPQVDHTSAEMLFALSFSAASSAR
jgi:hypothetical protein